MWFTSHVRVLLQLYLGNYSYVVFRQMYPFHGYIAYQNTVRGTELLRSTGHPCYFYKLYWYICVSKEKHMTKTGALRTLVQCLWFAFFFYLAELNRVLFSKHYTLINLYS